MEMYDGLKIPRRRRDFLSCSIKPMSCCLVSDPAPSSNVDCISNFISCDDCIFNHLNFKKSKQYLLDKG